MLAEAPAQGGTLRRRQCFGGVGGCGGGYRVGLVLRCLPWHSSDECTHAQQHASTITGTACTNQGELARSKAQKWQPRTNYPGAETPNEFSISDTHKYILYAMVSHA